MASKAVYCIIQLDDGQSKKKKIMSEIFNA